MILLTCFLFCIGFTTIDLGCERGNNAFNFVSRIDAPQSRMFLNAFNTIWNSPSQAQDVTETVLESITAAYKENAPEFLYFLTLYNIFSEFLEDISEDVLPNEGVGFRNSQIWNKLYDFQQDAVLAIINKLEKYNGCILADSVGLGKTFSALGVIKYYEDRNKNVLVLCPKKLAGTSTTHFLSARAPAVRTGFRLLAIHSVSWNGIGSKARCFPPRRPERGVAGSSGLSGIPFASLW